MRDLFEREQLIYDSACERANDSDEGAYDLSKYKALASEYGRLLRQLRRITRISDKTEVDLNASKLDLLSKLLRMSSLSESSPNFTSYKKLTGECVYLNPAASEITGFSHDELMQDYIGLLFDTDTAEHLRNEIPKALIEKGVLSYEVSVKFKNGEKREFSVYSFLVESDELAFGTVATDITEKKRLENEILAALDEAERASRAKSDFLSRMSHEMRNPMNAIIGMAALAKKTDDNEEAKKCLDKINGAAEHLLGIINDILDMSRLASGEAELSLEEFAIKDILDQAATVAGFKISEKRQHLSVELDGNIPEFIITDKQKLSQVIANLLSNASKFTGEGGNIGLTARQAEDLGGRRRIEIIVRDDGIGIAEEQIPRLFKAFEQSGNAITRVYGGAGLGLAISQRFANMMGGGIEVESELGKGSVFRVEIVADVGGCHTADSAEECGGAIFAGKRALLVDDVEINREILSSLLEDTGITIDCAENGRIACEMFAANPGYDIILMDIHMPMMSGYEAAMRIRHMNIPAARIIPIIAVTADVIDAEIEAAGMSGHLPKPLNITDVITKMKQYLL